MSEYDDLINSMASGMPNPEEEQQSFVRELAAKGLSGLQYVGESLDKPGQAIRGLLAGKPWELLNLIPFSDALGLTSSEGWLGKGRYNVTDDEDAVSGRDLLEQYGVLNANQEGLDAGDVAGLGAELLLDPTTYLTFGGSALTKAGKAMKAAGLLPDAFTQAKRLGKAVKGQASARHALTPNEILAAAKANDPNAEAKFLSAYFKGDAAGKNLGHVEGLDESIGGLFNARFPFTQGITVRGEPVADVLDKTVGKVRYGTGVARGFNRLFDAGHSKGVKDESRYFQEVVLPNLKLYKQHAENQINPLITEEIARIAQGGEELANSGVLAHDPDLTNAIFRAAEGTGADPLRIRELNERINQAQRGLMDEAGVDIPDFYDATIDHAVRHKLAEATPTVGVAGQPVDIQARRYDELTQLEGGTARLRNLFQHAGYNKQQALAEARLNHALPKDVLAAKLRAFDPNATTYSTLDAKQAAEQLQSLTTGPQQAFGPGKKVTDAETLRILKQNLPPDVWETYRANRLSPKEFETFTDNLSEGSNLDRYDAIAKLALGLPDETLKAGLYMDLPGSQQLMSRATAEKYAMAKAFRDAIAEPELASKYAGSPMIDVNSAAKLLGINPASFNSQNINIPQVLVNELLAKPDRFNMPRLLKNITQLNKAWMTGAIINPSFPVRNRFSGATENVYLGDVGPVSAAKGFFQSLLGRSPAQLLAKGRDIPGASEIPALQELARQSGRTLADDTEASNFLRELYAAYGGHAVGQHTADTILDNQRGVGKFLGGMTGPQGEDAFSKWKVAQEAAQAGPQLTSWQGIKDLFTGVQGTDFGQPGVLRQEPTSALLKSGKTLNDYVEAQNRFGPFFELLKQGVDPAEAMRRVNRSQLDYRSGNYTPFENDVMTLLAPFWKFSKGSALTHADELLQRPGGPLSHLLQTTGQLNDQDEVLPPHVKEKLSIPVDKIPFIGDLLASGDADTKRYLTGLGMAYEDPLTWVTGGQGDIPVGLETLNEGLGRLNPLVKMLGELATGRSFFQRDETGSGRLLADQDPPIGRLLSNLKQWATGEALDSAQSTLDAKKTSPGVLIEAVAGNSPMTRVISTLKNLTDYRENARPKSLINLLTGLRSSDVTPQMQDAVLGGLRNERIGEMPEAKTRTTVYVPVKYRSDLDAQKLETLQAVRMLDRLLNRRQKQRLRDELSTNALPSDQLAALLAP